METVIAAMVGLVGVFLAIGAAWIRAGFGEVRAEIRGVRAAMDERFDKVDITLGEHGERIARMEGALVASGVPVALTTPAPGHPTVGSAPAEAVPG